ncbi:FHA domain-containing protein [Arthrobacter sp. CAU 1506]|uniref:FHA domain-containing protein n=1 Tax=Arthrobacter sp. CAU 1506 TaxID=2560052 RepID=UPI0010AD9690|nr:FHA domain-containing protein [Arthrobacter sp. CAU 1506]TJY72301.1 FHA domain-containing protein [Arthrobacter sp. CAU 1506]
MTGLTYSPGAWIGLVSGGTAVLLEPGAADDLVQQLWRELESGSTLESLLGTIVSCCGANLSAMPQFGIISSTGGIHAVLRGDVVVSADSDGQELSGRGVSSWTEGRLASDKVTIAAGSGASGTAAQPGPWLPLRAGAVQLGILRLGRVVEASDDARASGASSDTAKPRPEAAVRPRHAEAAAPRQAGAAVPVPASVGAESNLDMTGIYVPDDELVDEPDDELDDAAAAADPASAVEQPAGGQADTHGEAAVDDLDQTVIHAAAQRANLPPAPPQQSNVQGRGAAVAPDTPDGRAGGNPTRPADLIDAVPWLTRSASARAEVPPTGQQTAQPTVLPTVQPTAQPAGSDEGDHDGQTLMRSELPDLSAVPAAPTPASASSTAPSTAPMVLARMCRHGHANPPTTSACALCGAALEQDAQEVQRPALGRMRISTGDVVELDRPVIVGRQPSANRVQGSVMPRLVPVHSASGDISRSHVEVRLEGWHVILSDLKSTNGTVLLRGRQAPRRLGHGEAVMLLDGDIADLGDGISLRFEDLP